MGRCKNIKNRGVLLSKKLTIYAVANILNLPRETVRRKIEILKKKKLINHSTTTRSVANK